MTFSPWHNYAWAAALFLLAVLVLPVDRIGLAMMVGWLHFLYERLPEAVEVSK